MTNEANVDRNIKLFTYLSVLITSGIIVLSLFLPFAGYRFSDISEDFSLWKKGDGYFLLLIGTLGLIAAGVVGIVLDIKNKKSKSIN